MWSYLNYDFKAASIAFVNGVEISCEYAVVTWSLSAKVTVPATSAGHILSKQNKDEVLIKVAPLALAMSESRDA
jgi:hypothetical protein